MFPIIFIINPRFISVLAAGLTVASGFLVLRCLCFHVVLGQAVALTD